MNMKINYTYKNQDGEYFKTVEKYGEIVLSNPSYPFVFKKVEYDWGEGDSFTVKVDGNGNLVKSDPSQSPKKEGV